jgi:hypothetical protein
MTMCPTGALGLISAPQGGCSSIGNAVCVTAPTPSSLSSLSASAGKTAPHGMLEFYNFCRETSYKAIGFSTVSTTGSNGSASSGTILCICSNPGMVACQCYTIQLCHALCVNSCTGSVARVCVFCNGGVLYSCQINNGSVGVSVSCSFVVTEGQTWCVHMCAIHGLAGGSPVSCSRTFINGITPTEGLFCEALLGTDITVYTC